MFDKEKCLLGLYNFEVKRSLLTGGDKYRFDFQSKHMEYKYRLEWCTKSLTKQ